MSGAHQELAYVDDLNLIVDDIRIEINGDELFNACIYFGLAVNTGKSKYMKVEGYRDMMTNEQITVGSNSHEKVKKIKYLCSLLTYENSIHKKIKC